MAGEIDPEKPRDTREAIVVLGMHRSGTSLCMDVLRQLGVRVDDDIIPADAYNEKGYFESRELLDLNDSILKKYGASWHTLFSVAVPQDWLNDPALLPTKERISSLVNRKVRQPGVWGIKDPRLCPLLPVYDEVFSACAVEPVYVVCIRDPRAVAHSLMRRDNLPQVVSELLWMDYTMAAFAVAPGRIRAVVEYEKWSTGGLNQVRSLIRALRLGDDRADSPEAIVAKAVRPDLDHGSCENFAFAGTESIYRLLQNGDDKKAVAEYFEVRRALRLAMHANIDSGAGAALITGSHTRIICQIFWRTSESDAFTEADSSKQSIDVHSGVDAEARIVRLPIPAKHGLTALRLDPANVPGFARLLSIRLLHSDNRTLWEWDGRADSLTERESHNVSLLTEADGPGAIAYFQTDDPGFVLPVSKELDEISGRGGTLEFKFAWLGGAAQPELARKLYFRSTEGASLWRQSIQKVFRHP